MGFGKKLFSAARLNHEYFLLCDNEIKNLHEELVNNLTKLPNGPYRALSSVVGQVKAKELAEKGEVALPDSFKNRNTSRSESSRKHALGDNGRASQSPRKRPRFDWVDSIDGMDTEAE